MSDEKTSLQDLLYNFTVLHESWSAEKFAFTKQVIKVEQLIKGFTVQLHEFAEINASVKDGLNTTLKEAVQDISDETTEAIKETASDAIENVVHDLRKATFEAKQEIDKWQLDVVSSTFKGIVIGVISSFLVSFITVKFLL